MIKILIPSNIRVQENIYYVKCPKLPQSDSNFGSFLDEWRTDCSRLAPDLSLSNPETHCIRLNFLNFSGLIGGFTSY